MLSNWNTGALEGLLNPYRITLDCSPTSTAKNGISFFRNLPIYPGTKKFNVAREILTCFSSSKYGSLISGHTVTRLVSDDQGKIISAETRKLDQRTVYIKANIFIIACGGIETPRLLLLSGSKNIPNGLGNNYAQVGRYFMEHPRIIYYGKIAHTPGTIYPSYKIARSYEYYEKFKKEGLGSIRMGFIQSWIFPYDVKNISLKKLIPIFVKIIKRIPRADLMITATVEMYPSEKNRITLSENLKDIFGNPAANLYLGFGKSDLETLEKTRMLINTIYREIGARDVYEEEISWTHHHMGTCRMGNDPRTSVVDRNLKVHDSPNLYIAGSSVFVTSGASPPTLTIVAFSHRLAEHIISKVNAKNNVNL